MMQLSPSLGAELTFPPSSDMGTTPEVQLRIDALVRGSVSSAERAVVECGITDHALASFVMPGYVMLFRGVLDDALLMSSLQKVQSACRTAGSEGGQGAAGKAAVLPHSFSMELSPAHPCC